MRNFLKETLRSYAYPKETIFSEQFMYGHREVIVQSLKFDDCTIFTAGVQHGWSTNSRVYSNFVDSPSTIRDRFGKKRDYLVWSRLLQSSFLQEYGRETRLISSPWSLLVNLKKQEKKMHALSKSYEEKDSILYFPYHSYPGIEEVSEPFIETIIHDFNPKKVTTSLYWLDYLDLKKRSFYSDFSEVTTCGYRGSAATEAPWTNVGGRVYFLLNLFELINRHELIICDDVSTAFAAACSLGKKVLLTKPEDRTDGRIYRSTSVYRFPEISKQSMFDLNFGKIRGFGFGEVIDSGVELQERAQLGFGFDVSESETIQTLTRNSYETQKPDICQSVRALKNHDLWPLST